MLSPSKVSNNITGGVQMKRTILIIVTVLAVAGLTLAASYECQKACCKMGPHMPVGKMLNDPEFVEKLGLTSDQVAKLKKLHYEHQKAMIGLHSSLKMLELDLANLADAEKLDKNMIRQKVKEISAVKADIALNMVDMKLSAADVLTKEQIGMIKKMKGEAMCGSGMKKGERGERPCRMMMRQCSPERGVWIDDDEEKRIIIKELEDEMEED